jgi:biotin-(acetyl-CoA carboxylase) ligase
MPRKGFDQSIHNTATAMYKTGGARRVKKVLFKVLEEMRSLMLENDEKSLLYEYKIRGLKSGQTVEVSEGRMQGIATVLDITDDFKLAVMQDGKRCELDGGEVRIKIN